MRYKVLVDYINSKGKLTHDRITLYADNPEKAASAAMYDVKVLYKPIAIAGAHVEEAPIKRRKKAVQK